MKKSSTPNFTFTEEAKELLARFTPLFFFVKRPKPKYEWGQKAIVVAVLQEGVDWYTFISFDWNEGVFDFDTEGVLGKAVPEQERRFTWEAIKSKDEAFQLIHDFYHEKVWGNNYDEHLKLVGAA